MASSTDPNRTIVHRLVMRAWIWFGAIAGLPLVLVAGYRFCASFFTASYDETAFLAAAFLVALGVWLVCCWLVKRDLEKSSDDEPRFTGPNENFEAEQARRLREVERLYANASTARRR